MSKEIEQFDNKYMSLMAQYSLLDRLIKDSTAQQKKMKEDLFEAMKKYNIQSIDNDYIKTSVVKESKTTSVDLKKLQEKEPKLYGELLEDYPKVSTRAGHIKVTVK